MILILDTSPICFLVLIGEVEILPKLFPEIVAPQGVLQELRHPKAPSVVREWTQRLPPWLTIRSANPAISSSLDFLDPGEREVIALGLELPDSVVVLDDQVAREEARGRGLEITGLLGILDLAAKLDILDLRIAISSLQKTHFRASASLIRNIIQRHEKEKGS